MWMDRFCDVGDDGGHFDGQCRFGNQLTGSGTDDADAEDAFRDGFDNDLGQTVGSAKRHGAA